jgi:hypothetical protein
MPSRPVVCTCPEIKLPTWVLLFVPVVSPVFENDG